jgi:hypothetical protein
VKALGYVKNKQLVDRFLPRLAFDFFSRKDINLFYKPGHSKVNDFIASKFDVLIDLSPEGELPLKYISGLSHALCRVGRFSNNYTVCYDLMISTDPSATIQELIDHVLHYLSVLNSSKE